MSLVPTREEQAHSDGYLEGSSYAYKIVDHLAAENARLKAALEKIACRHVTESPLWWQQEARAALDPVTSS